MLTKHVFHTIHTEMNMMLGLCHLRMYNWIAIEHRLNENITQANIIYFRCDKCVWQKHFIETRIASLCFALHWIMANMLIACFLFLFRHILSLSIADLMLILTAVPFVSVVYTVESWPWGTGVCMISEFMKDFSTGVSVFTLVAMSCDRFVAIVNPLRRFRGTGKFCIHFPFSALSITYSCICSRESMWLK